MRRPLAGEVGMQPFEQAGPLVLDGTGELVALGLADHVLLPRPGDRKMSVRVVVHVHWTGQGAGFFPAR